MSHQGEESSFIGFTEVMVNKPQLYKASQLLDEEKNTNPSFFDDEAYQNLSSSGAPWTLSRSPLDANIDNLSLHQFTIYLIHVFREADAGWKNETGEVPVIFKRMICIFNKILDQAQRLKDGRHKIVVELYNIISLMQFIYMSFTPCDSQKHTCREEVHRFVSKLRHIDRHYERMNDRKKFTILISRRLHCFENFVLMFFKMYDVSIDADGRSVLAIRDIPNRENIVPVIYLNLLTQFEFVEHPSAICNLHVVQNTIRGNIINAQDFFTNIVTPYIGSTSRGNRMMTSNESLRKLHQLKPSNLRKERSGAVLVMSVVNFQLRIFERTNDLRSRNESFTSDEVKYIFYFAIRALHFIVTSETDIHLDTIKETVTILSTVLNQLCSAKFIGIIDFDTAYVLKLAIDDLSDKYGAEFRKIAYTSHRVLYWIPCIILMCQGGYKKYTLTNNRMLLCKISMELCDFIRSSDDIKADRNRWIETLTRFESGADFCRKYNEGECPVCILETDHFAIFGCGHGGLFPLFGRNGGQ